MKKHCFSGKSKYFKVKPFKTSRIKIHIQILVKIYLQSGFHSKILRNSHYMHMIVYIYKELVYDGNTVKSSIARERKDFCLHFPPVFAFAILEERENEQEQSKIINIPNRVTIYQ